MQSVLTCRDSVSGGNMAASGRNRRGFSSRPASRYCAACFTFQGIPSRRIGWPFQPCTEFCGPPLFNRAGRGGARWHQEEMWKWDSSGPNDTFGRDESAGARGVFVGLCDSQICLWQGGGGGEGLQHVLCCCAMRTRDPWSGEAQGVDGRYNARRSGLTHTETR